MRFPALPLLALLLLFSLAQAANTTPNQTGDRTAACALDAMTAAETQQFWDATFNFQGATITDASDRALAANATQRVTPPNNTNGSVQPAEEELVWPLEQTARSFGLNPQDVSQDTGVPVNGALTYEQVQQVAQNRQVSDWEQLISTVLPQKKSEQGATHYDTGQVTLPNGRKMLVSDLERLQVMNADSCLLDNTDLRGTISYIGLMGRTKDYDLSIGFHRNPTILQTPQHLTTGALTGAVSWGNNGANILIPHSFEKWLKAFSTINLIDVVFNTAGALYIYGAKSKIKSVEDLDKDVARIMERDGQEGVKMRGLAEERSLAESTRSLAEKEIGDIEHVAAGPPARALTPEENARITELTERKTAANEEIERFKEQQETMFNKTMKDSADLAKTVATQSVAKKLDDYEEIFKVLRRRVSYGFVLGSLWLGPARFAYQINDAIALSSRGMSADKRKEYYLKMFVNKDVAEEFRSSTDFLGLGRLLEIVSGVFHVNAPEEAFRANSYYLINIAEKQENPEESLSTSVGFSDGAWQIQTIWPQPASSTLTVFEKVKSSTKFSSMPLETNMLPADAIVDDKELQKHAAISVMYGLPFVMTFKITQVPGRLLTLVPFLLVNQIVMKIDHDKFKNVECSDEKIDDYIYQYGAVVAASNAMNLIPLMPALKTLKAAELLKVDAIAPAAFKASAPAAFFTKTRMIPVMRLIDAIALPQALQMIVSSNAMEYVSSCKDNKYTILTYQQLPEQKESSLGQTLAQLGSTSPLAGNASFRLNILDALNGLGQKVLEAERPELLHLNAVLEGQEGIVQPDDLYYLELSTANLEWWNSFENKCFRMCFDSTNYSICIDGERGVYWRDRTTGEMIQIADADRAKLQELATPLGRAIIPNALIYAPMTCGSKKIMQVDTRAALSVTDATCETTACLLQKLGELTGASIDPADLTAQLGRVQRVHTTDGQAVLSTPDETQATTIRFIRTVSTSKEPTGFFSFLQDNETIPPGAELQVPAPQAMENESYARGLLTTSAINVFGSGRVTASGVTSTGAGEEELGTLVKIQTERGRIDYDRLNNRLIVTVYVLAALPISQMRGIQTSVACDEIRIDQVLPKAGIGEDATNEFNNALQKIQEDCGFAVLETPDYRYYFHKDENGNDVLDVLNKKTGEWTRYNRTGPMRVEGDEIVVPTDQGDFRFKIFQDPQTGKPMLQVTFPNGQQDLGELVAARGQGGALFFDPRTGTWYAYNGQDIPLDPAFAQKGASFYQTDRGIVGQPSDGFLSGPQRQAATSSSDLLALLGLPAWPEPKKDALPFAAMLAAILGGVLIIRTRGAR
ncbi:hypothetical protein H0O03_03680 [Candidatus Micrarchaeota archaeon]|nr:hypothetical protein [Candidatus Micrarchaeota archaeon]